MTDPNTGADTVPKIVDEQCKEEIRALYAQGMSLTEIGRHQQISKQVVWYHVQKMGLIPPADVGKEEQVELLTLLAEESSEGITVNQAADILEVSKSRAKTLLKQMGLYTQKLPFASTVDRSRLIELYVIEDRSLSELAPDFPDVSPSTLSQTLKTLGIPVRPRGTGMGGKVREAWRREAMRKLGV